MSEQAPETGGGGGGGSFFTMKFLGIPAVAWIGVAALVAYFIFSKMNSSSASSAAAAVPSDTGGSGTITTGNTTIDTGAVQVTVNGGAGSDGGSSGSQPTPPSTGPTGTSSVLVPNVVGQRGETGEAAIHAAGLFNKISPAKKVPGKVYDISAESPKAGTSVAKGSTVSLTEKLKE